MARLNYKNRIKLEKSELEELKALGGARDEVQEERYQVLAREDKKRAAGKVHQASYKERLKSKLEELALPARDEGQKERCRVLKLKAKKAGLQYKFSEEVFNSSSGQSVSGEPQLDALMTDDVSDFNLLELGALPFQSQQNMLMTGAGFDSEVCMRWLEQWQQRGVVSTDGISPSQLINPSQGQPAVSGLPSGYGGESSGQEEENGSSDLLDPEERKKEQNRRFARASRYRQKEELERLEAEHESLVSIFNSRGIKLPTCEQKASQRAELKTIQLRLGPRTRLKLTVEDKEERKKEQNRMAQKAFQARKREKRKNLKERIENLRKILDEQYGEDRELLAEAPPGSELLQQSVGGSSGQMEPGAIDTDILVELFPGLY